MISEDFQEKNFLSDRKTIVMCRMRIPVSGKMLKEYLAFKFDHMTTVLVTMQSVMAFPALLTMHCTRFAGSWVQFSAEGPSVAFVTNSPAWVLLVSNSDSRKIFLHIITSHYLRAVFFSLRLNSASFPSFHHPWSELFFQRHCPEL